MPRYVLSGYGLAQNGLEFEQVNLVLRTASGVTEFSYTYNDDDGSAVLFDIPGNYTLLYDGIDVTDVALDIGFGTIKWGAGEATKLLVAQGGDVFFLAGVAGDTLPQFHRDQFHVFAEFSALVTGGHDITTGKYAPDQNIAIDDFFNGDLSGPIKHGTQGADTLVGGALGNVLVGQKGADVLKGKGGADTLMLGRGSDKGYGGSGDDMVSGYLGQDLIYGEKGRDTLIGGEANDKLWGQKGADILRGGTGADRLDGGGGDDRYTGGRGEDRFVFADGGDRDRINDFGQGPDRLVLNDNLWTGELTASEVVEEFATRGGGNITFDFGGGDVLVLRDYTALGTLDDFIDII